MGRVTVLCVLLHCWLNCTVDGVRGDNSTSLQPSWSMTSHQQPSWSITSQQQPSWNLTSQQQPSWNLTSHQQPSWSMTSHQQPSWNLTSHQQPSWRAGPNARVLREDVTFWGLRIPGLAVYSQCCGIVNDGARIVGGTGTRPNEFPWTAAIVLSGSNTPFCTGALINDRYVLTAAHCVDMFTSPQQLQVILGKHELLVNTGADLRLNVDRITIHPRYGTFFLFNDIALVKLATVLTLPVGDNLIAPLCLPSRSVFFNQDALVAGWGTTQEGSPQLPDRLQSVNMRVISNTVCALLNAPAPVLPDMVCAEGAPGTGACFGDWGAALMVRARRRPSRRVLLGLYSWGIGCARRFRPDVFVKVTWFLDWIIVNTSDAKYC